MDNKYKNGKIYKIVDVGYSKCYFGSTCEELSQRMARHRYKYPQYLKGKMHKIRVFGLFDEFGVENCKIELVELYPTNSKAELQQREGYYIKNNDCVNKRVEGRTDKEYRDDNKEREQARHKKYYAENQDKIQAYREANREEINARCKSYQERNKEAIYAKRNVKTKCDCGGSYTLRNRAQHNKSKKHTQFMNEMNSQTHLQQQSEQ